MLTQVTFGVLHLACDKLLWTLLALTGPGTIRCHFYFGRTRLKKTAEAEAQKRKLLQREEFAAQQKKERRRAEKGEEKDPNRRKKKKKKKDKDKDRD